MLDWYSVCAFLRSVLALIIYGPIVAYLLFWTLTQTIIHVKQTLLRYLDDRNILAFCFYIGWKLKYYKAILHNFIFDPN